MDFDEVHGWNEITAPLSIATQQTLVAAKPDFRIIVRRIRGASNGDFELRSNATKISSTFQSSTNIDIPGVQIKTKIGEALTIFGSLATVTNITVQYAYDYQVRPHNDQLI